MTNSPPNWLPLSRLEEQFQANLAALRKRDADLADRLANLHPKTEYFLATEQDRIILAELSAQGPRILTNILPPLKARQMVAQMFPGGIYNQPVLIAGLDQGWLWESMYRINTRLPYAPGMRLPLFLLTSQIERLWIVMHYQSWSELLSDSRVQLLAGPNAIHQLRARLMSDVCLPVPQMSVNIEPNIWPEGQTLQSITETAKSAAASRLSALQNETAIRQNSLNPTELASRFKNGSLRILGITSRYTTFLQHSMRDWLAALEKLGHQTRLMIEKADHELIPPVMYAEECRKFEPDLILILDHCRAEMPGLPRITPCVMWVQDRLPNIYRKEAGSMQEATDFVIGYGRQECTMQFGYPASRFMPAMVPVNEDRFLPMDLSAAERAEFGCDVSFVSHASLPAEQIIKEECERISSPPTRKLLQNIYEQLNAIYESGGSITQGPALNAIVDANLAELRLGGETSPLRDLVYQKINNALLRHQAIRWVASTGADLRLYGRGWENHPEFKKFARGVADNQKQLSLIYRASKINLQATPFGAAHQRMFEGLACGGFFLLRAVSGDLVDLLKREIWIWAERIGVRNGTELAVHGKNDPVFQWLMSQLQTLMAANPLDEPDVFYSGLEELAMNDFARCAATLWPEYSQVAFWSQSELSEKLSHYLENENQRQEIAMSMRRRVLERHTYTAISKRMLEFMANNLAAQPARIAAIAA